MHVRLNGIRFRRTSETVRTKLLPRPKQSQYQRTDSTEITTKGAMAAAKEHASAACMSRSGEGVTFCALSLLRKPQNLPMIRPAAAHRWVRVTTSSVVRFATREIDCKWAPPAYAYIITSRKVRRLVWQCDTKPTTPVCDSPGN